jgi:hypothetical protein
MTVFSGDGEPSRRFDSKGSSLKPVDSKLLYRGELGFRRLETVALAAFTVARKRCPDTLASLLGTHPLQLSEHPWYGSLAIGLPVEATASEIDELASCWEQIPDEGAPRLITADVEVALEGEFNKRLQVLGNKAEVELDMLRGLVQRTDHLGREVLFQIDRLGGRRFYGPWLATLYPMSFFQVLEQRRDLSSYVTESKGIRREFRFLVHGESHAIEIALASCLAKYVRELFMICLNDWWVGSRSIQRT